MPENCFYNVISLFQRRVFRIGTTVIVICSYSSVVLRNFPQECTKNKRMATDTSEHVVQLLFLSEKCVVSKAAIQLMELVHQTLKVW